MGFLRRIRGEADDEAGRPHEVASIYSGLRDGLLSLDPSSVGIHPTPEMPNVWGLVMDWSLDKAVATIVSLSDGTTSMYLSTGGGSIGAGGHPAPAAASIAAVRLAERMIGDFLPVSDSPVPVRGKTALTLLTFAGLRRFEDDKAAFTDGSSRLAPVGNAMQQVIHEIQQVQDSPKGT